VHICVRCLQRDVCLRRGHPRAASSLQDRQSTSPEMAVQTEHVVGVGVGGENQVRIGTGTDCWYRYIQLVNRRSCRPGDRDMRDGTRPPERASNPSWRMMGDMGLAVIERGVLTRWAWR
jgi:hypothetical protein